MTPSSQVMESPANPQRCATRAILWPADMFFVGTLKGAREVYLQTVLDCVWPFFEEHGVQGEDGPLRQRTRVLWPAGPSSPRVVPPTRGHRAPHDQGQEAPAQRDALTGSKLPGTILSCVCETHRAGSSRAIPSCRQRGMRSRTTLGRQLTRQRSHLGDHARRKNAHHTSSYLCQLVL